MPVDLDAEQPEEDGLLVRDANQWALDKLNIVDCYVGGFVNACKRAGTSQVVDGFAGPGVNQIGEELHWGTPMRILRATPEVDRVLAMDADAKCVDALQERTQGHPRMVVRQGDVNTDLIAAMDSVLEQRAPTLAVLDPEGTDVAYETLRALSQWRRGRTPVEILVLFPTDTGFMRMLTRKGNGFPYAADKLNRMFGTDQWEPIWRQRQQDGDAKDAVAKALKGYVTLYGRQFSELGYEHVMDREIRAEGHRGRRAYSLIFATSHDVGERIMGHCFDSVDRTGQMSMFASPGHSHIREYDAGKLRKL